MQPLLSKKFDKHNALGWTHLDEVGINYNDYSIYVYYKSIRVRFPFTITKNYIYSKAVYSNVMFIKTFMSFKGFFR
jgi:hypothetical protein